MLGLTGIGGCSPLIFNPGHQTMGTNSPGRATDGASNSPPTLNNNSALDMVNANTTNILKQSINGLGVISQAISGSTHIDILA